MTHSPILMLPPQSVSNAQWNAATPRRREHDTMSTGDLQEAVYATGDLAESYTDARTLWNSISRYLDDVPGAQKGEYGEWEYAGDEAVNATLLDSDSE